MSKLRTPTFTTTKLVVTVAIVLLLACIGSYWHFIYTKPSHVFNRMLANSLASTAVTKFVVQSDDTQNLTQAVTLQTEPAQQAHANSILTQAADPGTSIKTESIGTPTADFVRYTAIKTSQKTAAGKDFDFSSVLNLWGKSDQNDAESGGAQLFNQTLLGVIPVGDVAQPDRKALLKEIETTGVYKITSESSNHAFRPVITYNISVQPVPYVTMLKEFAHDLGITQLEQVDPTQYASSSPLSFAVEVDVWSGQLTKVTYKDSQRTEVYSGYGSRPSVALPTSSVSVEDLQTKLQQIQ